MTETLRDRSRARRRAAIQSSALELLAAQGYEATTVAQIADRAEVSERTVFLYFSSKLDLALSYVADSATRFSAVAALGAGETTLDLFRRWVEREIAEHGDVRELHHAMLRSNPALRGAQTKEAIAAGRTTMALLSRDLGGAPDDATVMLVGGAMDGVVSVFGELRPDKVDPLRALHIADRMLRALLESAGSSPDQQTVSRRVDPVISGRSDG